MWNGLSIKRLSKIINGATPKSDKEMYWEGDICWVTPADLSKINSPYVSGGERKISRAGYESCGTSLVPEGTVVISSRAPIGTLGIAAKELCTNQGCKSLVVGPNINNKYLYYVLLTSVDRLNILGKGTTFLELSADELGAYRICVPSTSEQQKIANFLDHETAKIDTLIEKQQQLIKLLQEKRQAVISHAVTKGLNPNAPMRDSGVEGLGEVPEHWVVTRAKFLFDFVTSGSRGWAEYYSDEGALFFRIANLTRDTIEPKLESIQKVEPPMGSEGERSRIELNDLLISITADLGSVCVADENIEGGYVSQHVSLCRPNNNVRSSRWLAYFILSNLAKEQLIGSGYGGTKVQLSLEDIRELLILQPIGDEQVKIERFIDAELEKFYRLMFLAETQIELLTERRTALISAAVTGKIDVRDWQPPQPESSEANRKEVA
jgi:type I restriction enzyme S subunit